jgi:hypothetical protein
MNLKIEFSIHLSSSYYKMTCVKHLPTDLQNIVHSYIDYEAPLQHLLREMVEEYCFFCRKPSPKQLFNWCMECQETICPDCRQECVVCNRSHCVVCPLYGGKCHYCYH